MTYAEILRYDGDVDRIPALTVSEYPYFQLQDITRKSRKKNLSYMNIFATFDIETSTIHPDPDVAPEGFMYHWQMDIGGVVVYGRRWEEWLDLMHKISDWLELSEEKRLVIYVHNLGYEFQFIKNFLISDLGGITVFALDKRVPLHVVCGAGFEFRCSYKLTNMSLKMAVKNELGVIHQKSAGDLDYKIVRTADDVLTAKEFGYCIGDVVSLYEMIERRLINEDDTLATIPLTSTGYIRRDTRSECRKDRHYRDRVFKKQRMTKDVYQMLKEAGRGGNTHANRYLSGRIWEKVASFDAASMYPAMLVLYDRFPSDKFSYYGDITSKAEFDDLCDRYCCLFRVILHDVKVRDDVAIPYIPSAKVTAHGPDSKYDNGRVLSSKWLLMTVTEIDWEIIDRQYEYSGIEISDFYIAARGFIPEPIRATVMKYFKEKSELKASLKKEEKEHGRQTDRYKELKYLYDRCKMRLNSIFGMCYTDPVRKMISIDDKGDWSESFPDIDEALDKFYKSRNSFLVYAFGVYTTALARRHLQRLLDITGDNTIYCDTDSDKFISSPEILEKIYILNKEVIALCEELEAYADADGVRYYMGVFEYEGTYNRFKTLGAKKYCYEDPDGFHITISGVEKETGAVEMGSIDNFIPGFIFRDAGGRTLYYNDDKKHYIEVNGCRMLTASNIGMVDSTYELGLTDEYAMLLGINVYKDVR